MKTPITDAIWDQTKGLQEFHAKLAEIAKRLEVDRAELMEALKEIHHYSDMGSFAENRAFSAISAARANFPTP